MSQGQLQEACNLIAAELEKRAGVFYLLSPNGSEDTEHFNAGAKWMFQIVVNTIKYDIAEKESN